MKELPHENGVCPHCGFDNASPANEPHQLECRSILVGSYLVGCVLGQGGFGITYVGWDLNLDLKIAIKEYYPLGFAARDTHTHVSVLSLTGDKKELYQRGKERFVNEAKTLARLTRDNGIVGVRGFFHENGTAYIIMDFVEGETLKSLATNSGGKLPAQETLRLFRPLCDSIARVHAVGLLHRDISPDNIILRPDGVLTLVDFGAARQISAYGEHSNTINVKHGFAPEEQYRTHGEQGPWSDVYALCATIYRLITGITPPQALDRLTSGAAITPPRQLGAELTPAQENALLHGLGINAQYRTRDMQLLIQELYGERAPQSAAAPAEQILSQQQRTSSMSAAPVREKPKQKEQKNSKKTIWITIGASLGTLLLLFNLIGAIRSADTTDQTAESSFGASAGAAAAADANSTAEETMPEETVPPDPVAQPLTLDYGEQYYCTVADFDQNYGIADNGVNWRSSNPDLVECDEMGSLRASNVQQDISLGYSDPVVVTGVSQSGVTFTYRVSVGNGTTYSLAESPNRRTLKDSIGYTHVPTPSIQNCVGFTIYLQYEAVEGSHNNTWVFWVHDSDGKWISFTDLALEDKVTSYFDLTFDHPIDVVEFVMQPVNDYKTKPFSYYTYYGVANVIYAD